MNYETSHVGFCITQLAYADDTFVNLKKRIEDEKLKLKPTAKGEQLKMFSEKTLLGVQPSTEFTYWEHERTLHKILSSIETPKFLKDYVTKLIKKRKEYGIGSQEYRKWKTEFFENSWSELVTDVDLLNDLTVENYEGQKSCRADILIPPTESDSF